MYTGCHSEPKEEDANCIYRMVPNGLSSTILLLERKVRSIILQTKKSAVTYHKFSIALL